MHYETSNVNASRAETFRGRYSSACAEDHQTQNLRAIPPHGCFLHAIAATDPGRPARSTSSCCAPARSTSRCCAPAHTSCCCAAWPPFAVARSAAAGDAAACCARCCMLRRLGGRASEWGCSVGGARRLRYRPLRGRHRTAARRDRACHGWTGRGTAASPEPDGAALRGWRVVCFQLAALTDVFSSQRAASDALL